MDELTFQEIVIQTIKREFPQVYVLNTCMRYTIGVPDLLIGLSGLFIGIELKVCKKDRATIQALFPKSRKQIPTLFDIERGMNKGYGLILFNRHRKVMLFRINFNKFPLDNSATLKHINCIQLSPFNNVYPEFIECYIEDDFNLHKLLKKIK
jgi:hypothetical protein